MVLYGASKRTGSVAARYKAPWSKGSLGPHLSPDAAQLRRTGRRVRATVFKDLRWIAKGKLKLRVEHVYPLEEAAQAMRDLEGRKTTGKLVLKIV